MSSVLKNGVPVNPDTHTSLRSPGGRCDQDVSGGGPQHGGRPGAATAGGRLHEGPAAPLHRPLPGRHAARDADAGSSQGEASVVSIWTVNFEFFE